MSKIDFSVIIPVYNTQDYLARCIDSVLSQSHSSFELILVNDNSIDESANICETYKKIDKRVKVIHLKENSGPSVARNTAIDAAKGSYFTFIDADDWIDKNFLQVMLEKSKADNSDIVSCTTVWTTGDKQIIKSEPSLNQDIILDREQALIRLFTDNGIMHTPWGKIYSAELFKTGIRYPERILLEDLLTTYKLIDKSTRITITNSTSYYYFQSNNSLTRGKFSSSTFEALPLLNEIPKYLGSPIGELEEAIEYCKYSTTIYAINSMLRDGGYPTQSSHLMNELSSQLEKYRRNRFFSTKKAILLLMMRYQPVYILYRKLMVVL